MQKKASLLQICQIGLAAVVALFLFSSVTHAQPRTICDAKDKSRRCLGGHLFVPSRIVSAPFMTTDLGTRFEGQYGTILDTRKTPYVSHQAAGGGLNYSLQIAVLDWLSVFGSVSGGGSRGLKGDIVNFGLGLSLDYDVGVKFRLWQNERILISTSAQLVGSAENIIKPIDLISRAPTEGTKWIDLMNRCRAAGDSDEADKACEEFQKILWSYEYDLGARIDALMALGISPIMGLYANVGYTHLFRSATNPLDFRGQVQGTLGLSLDIASITPVPIGFLLGAQYAYRFEYVSGFDRDVGALTLSGGIFYTGSSAFSVGLELSDEITPVLAGEAGSRANLFMGSINLRYFWN